MINVETEQRYIAALPVYSVLTTKVIRLFPLGGAIPSCIVDSKVENVDASSISYTEEWQTAIVLHHRQH
jgi:hypothetical protein